MYCNPAPTNIIKKNINPIATIMAIGNNIGYIKVIIILSVIKL